MITIQVKRGCSDEWKPYQLEPEIGKVDGTFCPACGLKLFPMLEDLDVGNPAEENENEESEAAEVKCGCGCWFKIWFDYNEDPNSGNWMTKIIEYDNPDQEGLKL